MKEKVVRFLAGGCVVNTVLICLLYILRELFPGNMLGREISIQVVFSILLISFIISGADLLLINPTAVGVILNYAATAGGILLVFRLIRGKYSSGAQITAIVAAYTAIYAAVVGVRLLVRFLLRRKKNEKQGYTAVFK